jgi:hypothetical protein
MKTYTKSFLFLIIILPMAARVPFASGQLLNGDFSNSTNHWRIVLPGSNTQTPANGLVPFDIDGPGPLPAAPAFFANVGNDALLYLEQDLNLVAGGFYRFAADLAMYPPGNNADGGTVTAYLGGNQLASHAFGSTTHGVYAYTNLLATCSPSLSGTQTLSIHFSRSFGAGGIYSTPTDYIDYIAFAPPPVPLNIRISGKTAILTWTNLAFALQGAPSASGAYTNIPGATSPYTNTIAGSQSFFRLASF